LDYLDSFHSRTHIELLGSLITNKGTDHTQLLSTELKSQHNLRQVFQCSLAFPNSGSGQFLAFRNCDSCSSQFHSYWDVSFLVEYLEWRRGLGKTLLRYEKEKESWTLLTLGLMGW